jgi:DNA segregation ATPase FtsK/SpoIIIE, S-DNA-T family
MPKNKKTTKKKSQVAEKKSSPMVQQISAVGLIIAAALLLVGHFGAGGPLPELASRVTDWILGYGKYALPIVFLYAAISKFAAEDHKLKTEKLFSSLLFLVSFSTFCGIVFENSATTKGNGGFVGNSIAQLLLNALDPVPLALIFFVLSVISAAWSLSITPLAIFRLVTSRRTAKDSDLADMKLSASGAASRASFSLNESVPVEHHEQKNPGRSNISIRNTASALSPKENHQALTTPNDPDWKLPPLSILDDKVEKADPGDVMGNAETIRQTLSHFGIAVEMEGANVGPRVTQYTLRPPAGTKLQKITSLESNIALDLAAQSIRMEAPIPGKKAVGVEVPNVKAASVTMRSLLNSKEWSTQNGHLGFVIGKDISGLAVVGALDKMPHLLVAGQTGSGKSVMINTLLTSFLYSCSPSDLKLILVDPKQVEMAPYRDIPHLLTPVITEPEKCISALKWSVAEMERRLKTFAAVSKRNIAEYNMLPDENNMPYIVIVIDELADLMMMAARDVESLIVRLAQKARAAGIHLVLATQRPSVDVITGLIKANIPARISFTVASQVDSRTIIDQVGAEKLLGKGDLLYSTADMAKPRRVQGALISDAETIKLCDFLREQRPPQYDDEVVAQLVQLNPKGGVIAEYTNAPSVADDDMWRDVVRATIDTGKASTSMLQRRLQIGYGRAARYMDQMEEQGIIGPASGTKPREVLVSSIDQVFGDNSTNTEEPLDY